MFRASLIFDVFLNKHNRAGAGNMPNMNALSLKCIVVSLLVV